MNYIVNEIINRNNSQLFKNRRIILESFLDGKIDEHNGLMDVFDLEIYDRGKTSFFRRFERAFCVSKIDNNIELSKYQIECLTLLQKGDLFISAPTSFGKTFIALEYIKRNENSLKNILFIVPTIALMNELFKKLMKIFGDTYNIILNDFEIEEDDINSKNIFIFVPERTMGERFNKLLEHIELDFCVYDEIYKLSKKRSRDKEDDDRLIIMNYVYINMLKKSKKLLLLGPFIKSLNFKNTNRKIIQYITDYTPVFSKVSYNPNYDWFFDNSKEKRLIYYSSPQKIQKDIIPLLEKQKLSTKFESEEIKEVVEWIKNNVYDKWYYIPLLKNGIGIHHGKTPIYLRYYIENSFRQDSYIDSIICTSTLMEGINTPTNKLIIVNIPDNTFELNNLIGRVARLNIDNPQKGTIISLENINESNLYNVEEWEEITLLCDDKDSQISNADEYLYLEKEEAAELYDEYKRFIDLLHSEYHLDENHIKKLGVKYNILYNYIKKNVHKTLKDYLDREEYKNSDVIDIMRTCIPFHKISKYFLRSNYKSIVKKTNDKGEEITHLSIAIPMKILMEQNTLKNVINYFQSTENPSFADINQYVDALLELENYIRFKFSQCIPLLKLFENDFTDKQLKKLNKFIDMVMNYVGKEERLRKVLLDLGIPAEDCNTIEVLLIEMDKTKSYKSSDILKKLRKLKKHPRLNELSPFSKKIINS